MEKFKPKSKPLKKQVLLAIASVTEQDVKSANRKMAKSLRPFIRAE